MMMRTWIGAFLALGLAACSPPSAPAADAPAIDAPAAAAPASIAYSVDLVFSEQAAAKLTSLGEAVIVSAAYFGDPKPGVELGDDPFVDLGSEERQVAPTTQSVALTGVWDQTRADDLAGAPWVNVNVFSARKTGPDNLLDCGLVAGALADVAARSNAIVCKLIGEQ